MQLIHPGLATNATQTPWFGSLGSFHVEWITLHAGRSCGVQVLTIDTGMIRAHILPTRGMGIWKADCCGTTIGWDSPVTGPVHPAFVPVHDATGVGWLEGFDELVVRCGLTSFGAPEFDSTGKVVWPLHGRIANLPATSLRLELDPNGDYLDVVGIVPETRFLVGNLELQARYRFYRDSAIVDLYDTVSNKSSQPATMQLLYHINVGAPILGPGSQLVASLDKVSPRDARAADGIKEWNHCHGPTAGYAEQVYLIEPKNNRQGLACAAIVNAQRDQAFAVSFHTGTLPYLTFWKNTGAVQDGYVIGIEPGTGFPYTRSAEEKAGRVVQLQAGESRDFHLQLEPASGLPAVDNLVRRIESI